LAFATNAPKLKLNPDPRFQVPTLNYRHHFHAGNFADVMKHALWLQLLARLIESPAPLTVIDTHAGAGLYDLQDVMARRSREAEAGVGRLMADEAAPAAFAPLKAAVRAVNPAGGLRFYPGSPLLSLGALRRGDRYEGCELRADDQHALQTLLGERMQSPRAAVAVSLADGYQRLGLDKPRSGERFACLIDPPFERGDEYEQVIAGVGRRLALDPMAVFAIWAPVKDLETFDALLRRLESLGPPSLMVAEARLRPLLNPMTLNGSAMILIGAPDLQAEAQAICDWVVKACGEQDGRALVRKLGRGAERSGLSDAG
jgi:23S rRNA (adenine2030-N6)-methyltransferase